MKFLAKICVITLLLAGIAASQDAAPMPRMPRRRPGPGSFPNQGQPIAQQNQLPAYPSPTPTPPPPQPGFPGRVVPPQPAPAATPLPTPAPTPPTPDLPPPVAPQVTFRDGLLTVQTTNSTLGGVLAAIRNKTGIQFEGLEGGLSERVALSLGPAPEGEVLSAILSGTRYDFVAIDRPDSPGIVQRVILTARAGSSPAGEDGRPVASSSSSDADEEEAEDNDPEGLKAPQDTPNRPPLVQVQQPQPQPKNPQVQNNPQPDTGPDPQPGQQSSPTPEELLKKLQDMRQPQNQSNPAPIKQPP